MTGYYEILTDPSYTGQMVLMTYPHISNYGVDADWSETSKEKEDVLSIDTIVSPRRQRHRRAEKSPVENGQ
jgi:carbamoyl-phosphate synthase small subunit